MTEFIIMGLWIEPRMMDTSQSNRGTRGHHLPYPGLCGRHTGLPLDALRQKKHSCLPIIIQRLSLEKNHTLDNGFGC